MFSTLVPREAGHSDSDVFAGSFYRGAGDRWSAVQDQDPLLLPGPDAGGAGAARREKLPHILPDAGRSYAGGAR